MISQQNISAETLMGANIVPGGGTTFRVWAPRAREVYLNGVQVFTARGYITDYIAAPLDDKAIAALKPGKNVIAVHCRQTGGGQYIDVGLSRLEEQPAR